MEKRSNEIGTQELDEISHMEYDNENSCSLGDVIILDHAKKLEHLLTHNDEKSEYVLGFGFFPKDEIPPPELAAAIAFGYDPLKKEKLIITQAFYIDGGRLNKIASVLHDHLLATNEGFALHWETGNHTESIQLSKDPERRTLLEVRSRAKDSTYSLSLDNLQDLYKMILRKAP